ncbi:MAG TPA: hypothetical protein VF407_05135 [Polyangiaceae bacterium]
MRALTAIVLLVGACVGCSTPSPSLAPDAAIADSGFGFDAGPSYVTPDEAPDEHYPAGFVCPTTNEPDGGTGGCDDRTGQNCCHADADCTRGFGGHCTAKDAAHIGICLYQDFCASSDGCATDTTCVCGTASAPGNRCSQSICRFDSDCVDGTYCSPSRTACFGGGRIADGVYCHTKDDRCFNDRDCPNGGTCGFVPEHAMWMCIDRVSCVISG